MPIYERGGSFMVSVGSGKDRFREMFRTRVEAEEAELKEKHRRKAQEASGGPVEAPKAQPVVAPGKTIEDAFRLTLRLRWKGNKAEHTAYKNGNSVVKALGSDMLLTDITPEKINEMLFEFEDLGNSGSTINRKMSSFSLMLKTALDQGWLKALPKVPRRREGAHRVRWLDEGEEAKILAKCDQLGLSDLRDFIIVAIDTGFRRTELMQLKAKDFANGLLHLHAGQTKTDEARAVPATKRVKDILDARKHLERIFEGLNNHSLRWQWDRLKDLMGMADDPQFIVHMLRHTCASRLVQRGVPLAMVQKWMGHKTIMTTMRYAHLAPDNLTQAMKALEKGFEVVEEEPAEVLPAVWEVVEATPAMSLEDADF